MSKSKIHNAHELEHSARKAGCKIENGGRHSHIVTPSGYSVPYPNHPGDLCNGTLHSILKMLKAAGIILTGIAILSITSPAFGYTLWCAIFGTQ